MSEYGAIDPPADSTKESQQEPDDSYVVIEADEENADQPTLGPIGMRGKRNAQIEYNPFDWSRTLFAFEGRPHIQSAFFWVAGIGTTLVIMSGIAGIGLEDERTCRAWCSRFALGAQPHQYIGFILFLLMSFRTQHAYKNYVTGQSAFYEIKTVMRRFTHILLDRVERDAMTESQRGRILAFLIAFPFALTADIRRERGYEEKEFREVLCDEDFERIKKAPSMPIYILESMSQMVDVYGENVPDGIKNKLHDTILAFYKPYGDCERVNRNPMSFSYVAHIRFLLVTYLTTLPLALVEQMGFSTIPVYWVIAYALISLEMLAVAVENPFGYQGSDLRLYQYNVLMRDTVMESWKTWKSDLRSIVEAEDEDTYAAFGEIPREDEKKSPWFIYW